jgi:hypothetical protein
MLDNKAALEQIDAALDAHKDYIDPTFGQPTPSEDRQIQSRVFSRLKATLERVAPPGSYYARKAQGRTNAYELAGALQAIRAEYAAGYLRSVEEMIHGATFSDFLEMASHLLTEGYKDAAAVIAGGVLEQNLRALCVKHSVSPIPANLNALNDALYRNPPSAYPAQWMKQITAWADIRNNAAHGHYDKVDAKQVELMIAGQRHLMLTFPA